MIQLNLLPDVKLEYLKAQRTRRTVFSIALIVSSVAVVILILLLGASGLQKKHLGDLNDDIKSRTQKLQSQPNIDKILTVQNQLQKLTELHSSKPAAARLFDYLNQVTPTKVNITEFNASFVDQKFSITGTAEKLENVNQYVDTLKYTTYTSDDNTDPTKAFSDVVLTSFGLNTGAASDGSLPATYTIDLVFDPAIFDNTQNVKLSVPKTTTTRINAPGASALFQQSTTTSGGTQ
jgi:hypothetical protein